MIPGFFDPARHPHPYLTVAVRIPLVTSDRWASVDFLVDTGAAQTCDHPLDAVLRLGVSPARLANPGLWPKAVGSGGVGGAAQYFECPANYAFLKDDGGWEFIDSVAWIAELTRHNQHLPSLLGWDLLKHFRLTTDGSTQTITLQRV